MRVGVLKEIKPEESRVSMTPAGVEVMTMHGHKVLVESGAGSGTGFSDAAYEASGAVIMSGAAEIYEQAQMIMHVKEPQPAEYQLMRPGQIIFTYLHLAASEQLTLAMLNSGCIGIAYETIQKADGSLPLLTPMSEVAGRMSIQEGAKYLEIPYGGKGVLLGGVPGVDPGTVVIIGAGVVGTNAAKTACGLGARVYLLDTSLDRLRYLSDVMPANCFLRMSTPAAVRELLVHADLVIGAVLVTGARAPRLVTNAMISEMKKGSVIVDVAIDQGGCLECSRPTTHSQPVFHQDGVVIYCVANMPGAVAKTSTLALTNATLPYAAGIADLGWKGACQANPEIVSGLNTVEGILTCKGAAEAFNLKYFDPRQLLD
ncbi:MAG: alanine dehydrogenase [Desulfonatronovibrionaceae bacterium]